MNFLADLETLRKHQERAHLFIYAFVLTLNFTRKYDIVFEFLQAQWSNKVSSNPEHESASFGVDLWLWYYVELLKVGETQHKQFITKICAFSLSILNKVRERKCEELWQCTIV